LNAYDILKSDDLIFSEAAINDFLTGPAKGKGVTAIAFESELTSKSEAEEVEVSA
jgi:large subunit ribosomal protein L4